MDHKVVQVRTSRSAQDFWSRERNEYDEVSPDFRVLPPNTNTPYGRQLPPFSNIPNRQLSNRQLPPLFPNFPSSPTHSYSVLQPTNSRVIERHVLCIDIRNADKNAHSILSENAQLRQDKKCLERQVKSLLNINYHLTKEMVESNENKKGDENF